jgi:hypothetical protein
VEILKKYKNGGWDLTPGTEKKRPQITSFDTSGVWKEHGKSMGRVWNPYVRCYS